MEKPTPAQLKLFAAILAGMLALLVLLAAIAAAVVYPNLPDISELKDYQPKQPLRVYTADEVQIGEYGAERRNFLPLDQIPKLMQDALLATEDADFYEHGALSYTGIARALLTNLLHGKTVGGASTITQQLARTLYLTRKKAYSRKFIEMLLSRKIENELSKKEILEIYMNQIYLGQKAYGFEGAANTYFGKSLKELSIAETAMLAGLPQNPGYANPIVNFDRAKRRQGVVLDRMLATGVITDKQAEAARDEKLHIRSAQDARIHAEYAAEMARQLVFAKFGEESYTRGLKVYTTLVATEQQTAYHALRRSLMDYERRKPYRGPEGFVELPEPTADNGAEIDSAIDDALSDHADNDELRSAVVTGVSAGKVQASLQGGEDLTITGDGLRGAQSALSDKAKDGQRIRRGSIIRVLRGAPTKAAPAGAWAIVQTPEAEGAFVAMEPASGRVHALVGGFDFSRNQFNHVTQAWRQPGSSFKPFVYSAALEAGVTPSTIVNDAPLTIGDWSPKNYEGTFDGPMTVRQALAHSKNLVTVRLMQLIGPTRARQWAAKFGFDIDKQPDNLTLSLGSGSVTPFQMVSAYSVFANGGYKVAPVVITKIVDSRGAVLFDGATPAAPSEDQRAIPERNAFVISSLLQEVTRSGTAAAAQAQLGRPDLYGKTGTTNDSVDNWFAGFQPGLAVVVWVGYDQPRGLGARETGGGLSLPVWIDYMRVALKGQPVKEIEPVEGVVQSNGDWAFDEYAGDAGIRTVGMEPDPAASAPANDPSGALLPAAPASKPSYLN
ncbi:PBP1A family penicillin-binding protein [Paucibacter sp. R3-3]|uniref:Penicillin-binding protein 1A n=1 Tax=Roseateles agri TaxID=3098619 RepID=A0ABU5DLF6_9BURK|nr:PBP1A family penicillin-binding protein [Paucibacter sp. R3-3]MDY0746099.1 PBP1A family penicillin-binding protein [Paucibacter sp. R3-3]